LHERWPALPPVHTRIIRGPEVDEDAVVYLRGDVTQHLSELACGEFARSTGAGHHLGQTLHHKNDLTQNSQNTQNESALRVPLFRVRLTFR
jgi:hypothetical protein